ncbi:unnamed protein product [Phytophthora fragariaefolia]|uniref:Unnamed protein product n=1 Tax=Phytophthora fragariaefolia TaxID=1490495 RepID=A0A9W6THY5_9STRA|nr:unnamed protein product [Phytophthora fragariaefolia]
MLRVLATMVKVQSRGRKEVRVEGVRPEVQSREIKELAVVCRRVQSEWKEVELEAVRRRVQSWRWKEVEVVVVRLKVESWKSDVRVSQIDTSVQHSQNTLTLLFGTPSDAEPELSPAAVTTAFDLSPSDLRLDTSQRDADEKTSEYESFSSGESDGVDFDKDYDEPELEVHDDNDVVLSDEDAIEMDKAFIKSLQVDNKTLDREALKLREDALRATEWACVTRRFAGYWSMVEDGAVPAGNFGRFMGRNRCQDILRDLHKVEIQTDRTRDKLWKLRPIADKIQQRFLAGWSLPAVFSFGESVLPCTSKRNTTRMFMPDKPHRYESKLFIVCFTQNFDARFFQSTAAQSRKPLSVTKICIHRGKCTPHHEASSAPSEKRSNMAEEDEGAPGIADTQPAQAPGADVPLRSPVIGSSPTVRVSPYPLRERTPPQHLSPPVASSCQRPRVSLDASPERLDQHRLQLVVQGIVKSTVGQRDSSGRVLEIFAANGATFSDIMHKIWEKFSCHVKGMAVKQDDTWTVERPAVSSWTRVMQFKANGRVVPTAKTQQQWSRWAVSQRGENVTLMINEYGLGISNARALDEFMQACIRPEHTDRSGAAAEASIREIVARLQDVWGATPPIHKSLSI